MKLLISFQNDSCQFLFFLPLSFLSFFSISRNYSFYLVVYVVFYQQPHYKIKHNNEKVTKFQTTLQNLPRIISASDISSIFPVVPTSSVLFLKQTVTQGFRPPFNRASIFAPSHLNIGCFLRALASL